MPEVTNPNLIKILNTKAQPIEDTTNGVFISAPGAQDEARRRDEQAKLDEARTGVTLEGGARAGREELTKKANELRGNFEAQKPVINYQIALPSYTSLLELAAQKRNKANDFMIVTLFNKVQDPGSAVLEGERKGAEDVSTLYEKHKNKLEGLFDPNVGFLSDDARRQFVASTHTLMTNHRRAYEGMRTRYADIAQAPEYNVRPELVIGPDFGDGYRPVIEGTWSKVFPQAGNEGPPPLRVAQGKKFSTEQDLANAEALNKLWASGASIEQMNAESIRLTTSPLSAEALDYLRKNEGNRNAPAVSPASSGNQEAPGLGTEIAAGIGGGLLRGSTANMVEELVNVVDPATAQKLQAAIDYGAEQAPVSNFAGELVGGVVSPLSRLAAPVSNPVLREALSGSAYGALYGAGEADPNAGLSERVVNAAIGGATGGAGGYIGGKIASRAAPEAGMADNAIPTPADPLGVPGAIGEVPTPAASDMEAIVDLARKATGRVPGPGRSAARRELAAIAKVNPEAAAAAERLGINLPPDVLSDNAQMLSLTGLARSQVGSEAENAWFNATKQAIARADTVMDEIGATTDLAQLSSDVSTKINASMDGLKQQATTLRDEVTAAFKPSDRLDAGSTKAALAKVIDELGGLDEASKAFSPEEKRLMAMLGKGEEAVQPTYAMVDRMRRQMGEALFEGKGPWVDADQAALKKFYGALADDQLAFIEQAGGKELADKQRAANSLFSEMYAKREELTELFGKDLSKSLTPLIRRAITTGAKGDAQALTKVLDNVPEDLRGRVLMSGLLAESSGKGAANGGFSFANFAKTYRGLRANAPIYKEFAKYIGPQGDQTLIDLYAISRRMVEAEAKVLKTGKANQAQLGQLNAENVLNKVVTSPLGRSLTVGAASALPGGPALAAGASWTADLATRAGGKSRTDKLHNLLSSEEFRTLMEKTATGETPDAAINRVAASKPFVEFAKKLPIPQTFKDRSAWIKSAFAQGGPNISGNPEPTQ